MAAAAVATPVAAPIAAAGFGGLTSRPAAAPASTAVAPLCSAPTVGVSSIFSPPAAVKFKFGLRVEPPVGGFGFSPGLIQRSFDPAWLERSSEGASGKCELSGWNDIVSCTKSVSPNGGTITARTVTPLVVLSSTAIGGIGVRSHSVCRFIINVKGGESMRHTFVGLLPGTAKATPRANPQDLGGWMLNVSDGHVSSSVRVTVSGARPIVLPGGAIQMVMDYDNQRCYIAVYTPDAVAARYSQPPQSVTLLEFEGRPFPADGTLYPAVSLCMDGVSVRVVEPLTSAALG
jgi:hypothetical protein